MSCPYLTSKTEIVSTKNDAESLETSKEVSMPVCKLCRKLDTDSWAARCRNTTPDGPCYVWVEQYGQTPDPKFQSTLLEAGGNEKNSLDSLAVKTLRVYPNYLHVTR